ncbi:hypothetical protein H6G94_34750 [Nostoc punctiforme FACHB-252]|uniref:Uncharacterized protein n=1 Tax=Nostoc punctiforme FACHB-252 TaxID=1357509 RepID=A0ABR8HKF3_NOSPU|nr:hypothetical protein [Nostoc punctiforme]MBD2616335.1 hypothetical protein [Nostoc punctiforme FACHB-252]
MIVRIQVVQKIYQEAHIDIPDMFCKDTMKQHIVDLYNSGEIIPDLNIFQIEFDSISATIVNEQKPVDFEEDAA